MTTLYRSVLIETAEQAEALPVGTFAVNWEIPSAAVRVGPDDADGWPWLVNSQNLGWHNSIVGYSALVPIEAEQDWGVKFRGHRRADAGFRREEAEAIARNHPSGTVVAVNRLTTPWEEA